MNIPKATQILAKAVAYEGSENIMGSLWDESWNADAHIECTLTIHEIRCATFLRDGKAPDWWKKSVKISKLS